LLAANAQGKERKQHLLGDVNYELTGSGFQLQLTFDRPYPEKKVGVELINHTIQVNLPGGYYKAGKSLKQVKDKKIQSVFTYQVNRNLLRSRIIYVPNHLVENLKDQIQIKSKGNVLLVKVYASDFVAAQALTKKLPIVPPAGLNGELKNIFRQATPKEFNAPEQAGRSAADIIKNDMNFPSIISHKKKNEEVPEIMMSKKLLTEKKSIDNHDNMESNKTLAESKIPVLIKNKTEMASHNSSSLYWRAGLSLLVILIFAGALVAGVKYWTRNRTGAQNQTKIRILAQHHLGPKKSLSNYTGSR